MSSRTSTARCQRRAPDRRARAGPGGPSPALACQCQAFDQALAQAKVVFAGTLTEVTRTARDPAACAKRPERRVDDYHDTVRVDGMWRRTIPVQVKVTGPLDCCAHHQPYARGERIVFVLCETAPRSIQLCDGTQPATPAIVQTLTRKLGAPQRPVI